MVGKALWFNDATKNEKKGKKKRVEFYRIHDPENILWSTEWKGKKERINFQHMGFKIEILSKTNLLPRPKRLIVFLSVSPLSLCRIQGDNTGPIRDERRNIYTEPDYIWTFIYIYIRERKRVSLSLPTSFCLTSLMPVCHLQLRLRERERTLSSFLFHLIANLLTWLILLISFSLLSFFIVM